MHSVHIKNSLLADQSEEPAIERNVQKGQQTPVLDPRCGVHANDPISYQDDLNTFRFNVRLSRIEYELTFIQDSWIRQCGLGSGSVKRRKSTTASELASPDKEVTSKAEVLPRAYEMIQYYD